MNPIWLHLITTAVLLSCAFVACDFTNGPPQIHIFPREQTVAGSGAAVFICAVTGNTNLPIKWRRNGRKIHYHPRNESFYDSLRATDEYIPKYEKIDLTNGSVLKINSAEPGTFECIIGNDTNEPVRATAQLKIINCPSEIEVFPRNQIVVSGKIAVFVCTVTGSPNLQIKWTRNNGKRIRNPMRSEIISHLQRYNDENIPKFETIGINNGLVLRIRALSQETFECVVGNGTKESVRAKADLNVVNENSKPGGFPHIAHPSTELLRVGKGHRTLLTCEVTGDPKPSIRWFKDKIPLDMTIPRYSLIEEQFLQISDVKEEDEGKYECIAANSVGSSLSSKVGLYVSEREYKPYFTIEPAQLYTVSPRKSLNITCLANGSPLPSVKWIEDSEDISPNRDGLNVLQLTDIQGSHNYTCVASSEMGNKVATAQVVAQSTFVPERDSLPPLGL